MKAVYVQPGETLDYTNPTSATIEAGTLVILGSRVGIAATRIPAGELGTVTLTGAWNMAKDNAAINAGAIVYYDSENDAVTATAPETDEVVVGFAAYDAAETDTTVTVVING